MQPKLSNRTLDELAHFIEWGFSHTEMTSLFLAVSVPNKLDDGANKLQRALNVVMGLASGDAENRRILKLLIDEALHRKKNVLIGRFARERMDPLLRALRSDGIEVVDDRLVSAGTLEKELAEESSLLDTRLKRYGMSDVVRYLEQAHGNFVDGKFEACNAMLRTSLESVLLQIATRHAGASGSVATTSKKGPTPADVRKHLQSQGFFTDDEVEFARSFYGYACAAGSHPGISNEADSRLRRLMTVAFIQYGLEKVEGNGS